MHGQMGGRGARASASAAKGGERVLRVAGASVNATATRREKGIEKWGNEEVRRGKRGKREEGDEKGEEETFDAKTAIGAGRFAARAAVGALEKLLEKPPSSQSRSRSCFLFPRGFSCALGALLSTCPVRRLTAAVGRVVVFSP